MTPTDSITAAPDTAAMLWPLREAPAEPAPFDTRLDTAVIATAPVGLTAPVVHETVDTTPPWQHGLQPEPRPEQPGSNSLLVGLIALMTVILAFNFRHLRRLSVAYIEELTKMRRGRDKVFDNRPAGDTRVTIWLVIQAAAACGILGAAGLAMEAVGAMALTVERVGAMCGLCLAYYLFMLTAYHAAGFAFGTPEQHRSLVRAYNASQALLGMALAVPALLSLFYPAIVTGAVIFGTVTYFAGRILFIFKGFRIFYSNIGSLLYFILYLCTLEIVPLVFVYKSAERLMEIAL